MNDLIVLGRIHAVESVREDLYKLRAALEATRRDGDQGILGRGAGGRHLSIAITDLEAVEDRLTRAISDAREEYNK